MPLIHPPHDPYANAPRRPSFLPIVILGALAMALLVFWLIRTGRLGTLHGAAEPRAVTPRGDLAADEQSTIEIFQQAAPSVVFVTNLTYTRDRYSLNVTEIAQGTGSGFIWDPRGYVVTNYHVVENGRAFKVTLSDGNEFDGQVAGSDPNHDLAVLKINAPLRSLQPIPVGTSKDLKVGQKVFAIGNPFGLDQTLTTGVISGLEREITSVTKRPIKGVIQTDAAINPGNSGGPLLDSAGRLIGVNTAIYSPSGAYAGIGFAVPVDTVNMIVPRIITNGRSQKAGLGVELLNDYWTRRLRTGGVMIRSVYPRSAAAGAGLRGISSSGSESIPGDVILAIDGEKVTRLLDVQGILTEHEPGDHVTLRIRRNGRDQDVRVTLQALN